MAKTLSNIQVAVQAITGNDKVNLTSDLGLSSSNRIYRKLAGAYPWPEFYKRMALNSGSAIVTVADQEEYALQVEAGNTTRFVNITSVEIQSTAYDVTTFGSAIFGVDTFGTGSGSTWKMIEQPPNELEWNLAGRLDSEAVPRYYRLVYNSGLKIAFRPTPSTADQAIRVCGIVEPTEFSSGSSTTEFHLATADDALEYLIAADWSTRNNVDGRSYVSEAKQLLEKIWGSTPVVQEGADA